VSLGPLSAGAIANSGSGATLGPVTTTEAPPPETTETEATTTSSSTQAPTTTPAPTPSTTSTSSTPPPSAAAEAEAQITAPAKPKAKRPVVVLQSSQQATPSKRESSTTSTTKPSEATPGAAGANGPNDVAAAPGVVGALAAELSGSAASTQALDFYRIPLFLLPIYQAASVQYGVPWQILAAINEIETDYGTDLSVSTAGAVGWMQFMPSTWIQYGVDALNAGYADPYNPVDAIFAAARYLRAAGAATDLHAAILAYNHSEEYAQSVLLRAKLISSYPKSVIATLTGLTDGRLPISGKQVTWGALAGEAAGTSQDAASPQSAGASSSSATAGATALASGADQAASAATAPTPAAAGGGKGAAKHAAPLQLIDLMGSPNASVVAAQDGRIVKLGHSRKLGDYVILRDVYGDVFTYAEMGSVATHYRKPKPPRAATPSSTPSLAGVADGSEAKPTQPATAGSHSPVTLKVKSHPASSAASTASDAEEPAPLGGGKVRLFAHPGNPDALASAAERKSKRSHSAGHMLVLRAGAIVSKGTVLGTVSTPPHAEDGHLRFAIRPGGDSATIDPRPILENWTQLSTALHPQGASGDTDLLGATASGVFLMSKDELERTVLSDPGIDVDAAGRQDIATGTIDKRVLAVLEFLSRIGLKPTVSALRSGHSEMTVSGFVSEHYTGDAVDISAVNGVPIAGHQGAGSITDLTIRALLTLQGEFVPHQIISLMQYPGAPNTLAMPEHWNHIHIGFRPAAGDVNVTPADAAKAAHSASKGKTAPAPVVTGSDLSSTQWNQLDSTIGGLPAPKVQSKRSGSAIKDSQSTKPGKSAGH
jgi:membrane-bound lytic murein transglycosylase B